MKALVIAIAMFSASAAFANHTPIKDTTSLTCQGAIGDIANNGWQDYTTNGGQVVTYFPDEDTAKDFAGADQKAYQAWVQTSDAKNCPIGFALEWSFENK